MQTRCRAGDLQKYKLCAASETCRTFLKLESRCGVVLQVKTFAYYLENVKLNSFGCGSITCNGNRTNIDQAI